MTRRMAISPPTPRWCWPSPQAPIPRALAEAIAAELGKLDEVDGVSVAGPGFLNMRLTDAAWRDELAAIPAAGEIMAVRRVAMASPSISNMSRPIRPGRCTWAIAAARWWATRLPRCWSLRATGHPRILCQRCGRAGRRPRPLGASALPRGAGRDDRNPRRPVSGRISEPIGAELAAEYGDKYVDAPRDRMAGPVPHPRGGGDDGDDPRGSGAAGHPSRHLLVRG